MTNASREVARRNAFERAPFQVYLAIAHYHRGQFDRAEQVLEEIANPLQRSARPTWLLPRAGVQLAVLAACGKPAEARAYYDDVLVPLQVSGSFGGGDRADRGTQLSVHGAEVSSLRRNGGGLEVRVFNPTASPATVVIAERSGWLVDLRGSPIAPFDGSFVLRPHGIATARLDD